MRSRLFDAAWCDRAGTLVHDLPYNGEPGLVRPVSGAREALDRLRGAGLRLGVVTNRSGLARGRFSNQDLARMHAAMAIGMPVVVLATTEAVTAVPAAAGVLATRIDTLVDAARWLLDESAAARRLGERAQEAR